MARCKYSSRCGIWIKVVVITLLLAVIVGRIFLVNVIDGYKRLKRAHSTLSSNDIAIPPGNGVIEFGASAANITCLENRTIFCELNERLENNITSYIIELQQKYPSINDRDDGWEFYRFGDMFESVRQRRMSLGYGFHKKHFPTSITTEYLDKIDTLHDDGGNYTVLNEIIQNRTQIKLANGELTELENKNQLIAHLRTGDVFDTKSISVSERLIRPSTFWIMPLEFYQKILSDIQPYRFTHVLFVTGYHGSGHHNHQKTIEYIAKVMRLFEWNGYNVSLRVNESPDDDLLLMMNSPYFVQGGGVFSRVIGKMVKFNNGTLFK